jgi:hypothetical protein
MRIRDKQAGKEVSWASLSGQKQGQQGNDLATTNISETAHQYKQNIQHNQWNSVTPP